MLTSVLQTEYQPKTFFWETKSFDRKQATVVCLGHRLSKHKIKKYVRNLGGMEPIRDATSSGGGQFSRNFIR